MQPVTICAVINTYNEERYLANCLGHLRWVDEIVVVDMHSTDKSVEICRQYTDKIYFHQPEISVLYARNFAVSKAASDWVLVVDPDEIIPPALAKKIRELTSAPGDFSALALPRQAIFFGKQLKSYPVEFQVRCFRRGAAFYPERVHSLPEIQGEVYYIRQEQGLSMLHYPWNNIYESLEKINRYTSDEARHRYTDDGVRFSFYRLLKNPASELIHRYFLRRGYRDGIEGFLASALMAFYHFLIQAKLWEIEAGIKK